MIRESLTISFVVFLLALASAMLGSPAWLQQTLGLVGLPGAVAAVYTIVGAYPRR